MLAGLRTLIQTGHAADLKGRSIEDYAVLLTPQKNGNGPGTIPVMFLRQA
jgi:hypothetical protein